MASQSKSNEVSRSLALYLASIGVWALVTVISYRLLRHYPNSGGLRGLSVALGVLGYIPSQVFVVWLIRHYDEYTRRLYLISFAIAFGVTGLFIVTCNLLQRAGFIDYVSLMTIWMVMIGSWTVAFMGANWYYCR